MSIKNTITETATAIEIKFTKPELTPDNQVNLKIGFADIITIPTSNSVFNERYFLRLRKALQVQLGRVDMWMDTDLTERGMEL